jgi:ApaG protein
MFFMVTKITSGIKITVVTNFEGSFPKGNALQHAFTYHITIENTSKDTVQLLSRHWEIIDSLNATQTVIGEGVVGAKPIIEPFEKHQYQSGCILQSSIGAMHGNYTFINFSTGEQFKVTIPAFKLMAPSVLN